MVFRYSGNVKSAPLSLRAGMTTASHARALCAGPVHERRPRWVRRRSPAVVVLRQLVEVFEETRRRRLPGARPGSPGPICSRARCTMPATCLPGRTVGQLNPLWLLPPYTASISPS